MHTSQLFNLELIESHTAPDIGGKKDAKDEMDDVNGSGIKKKGKNKKKRKSGIHGQLDE